MDILSSHLSIYAVYNAMLFVKFTLDTYLYKVTNCSGVLKENDAYAFPPHSFIMFFSKIIWCLTTKKTMWPHNAIAA